mmetsp:Transcript_7855/g.18127  ORF Transcript_7855/g.18127 Transcript_7855/m.18127 type:complete len:271 (+) Transcript_7855:573-1385(+)
MLRKHRVSLCSHVCELGLGLLLHLLGARAREGALCLVDLRLELVLELSHLVIPLLGSPAQVRVLGRDHLGVGRLALGVVDVPLQLTDPPSDVAHLLPCTRQLRQGVLPRLLGGALQLPLHVGEGPGLDRVGHLLVDEDAGRGRHARRLLDRPCLLLALLLPRQPVRLPVLEHDLMVVRVPLRHLLHLLLLLVLPRAPPLQLHVLHAVLGLLAQPRRLDRRLAHLLPQLLQGLPVLLELLVRRRLLHPHLPGVPAVGAAEVVHLGSVPALD